MKKITQKANNAVKTNALIKRNQILSIATSTVILVRSFSSATGSTNISLLPKSRKVKFRETSLPL